MSVRLLRAQWKMPVGAALAMIAALSSCNSSPTDDGGNSNCGAATATTWTVSESGGFTEQPTTGVTNGIRFYSWTHNFANLCIAGASSGNSVAFDFKADNTTPFGSVSGRVYTATGTQLKKDFLVQTAGNIGDDWDFVFKKTFSDISLATSSTDGVKATIQTEVYVTFTSTGGETADLNILKQFMWGFTVTANYHALKP